MKPVPKLSIYLILLASISIVILIGCTQRNNLTGNNWSGQSFLTTKDTTFVMGFSYQHAGKIKGNENILLCGTSQNVTAMSILQFTDLPDSITISGQPLLKIVLNKNSNYTRDPVILSFHKLNCNWKADSTEVISETNLTDLDMPNFAVLDTLTINDTLSIQIPAAIIQNWQVSGVTGFNIVIKVQGNGWVEFKSMESTSKPQLIFKYTRLSDQTVKEYKKNPTQDASKLIDNQIDIINNQWLIKNTFPQRLFIQTLLPNTIFRDKEGNILNDTSRKRMTINKAELVLYLKDKNYYSSVAASLYPYIVKDTLSIPRVLVDSDLGTVTGTVWSNYLINADSVKINITPIIQGYTSGDLSNNGLVIKLNQELQNFGYLEFWHFHDAPSNKKPYIKIYYTPPILPLDF